MHAREEQALQGGVGRKTQSLTSLMDARERQLFDISKIPGPSSVSRVREVYEKRAFQASDIRESMVETKHWLAYD